MSLHSFVSKQALDRLIFQHHLLSFRNDFEAATLSFTWRPFLHQILLISQVMMFLTCSHKAMLKAFGHSSGTCKTKNVKETNLSEHSIKVSYFIKFDLTWSSRGPQRSLTMRTDLLNQKCNTWTKDIDKCNVFSGFWACFKKLSTFTYVKYWII